MKFLSTIVLGLEVVSSYYEASASRTAATPLLRQRQVKNNENNKEEGTSSGVEAFNKKESEEFWSRLMVQRGKQTLENYNLELSNI